MTIILSKLDEITDKIRARFEALDAAREAAYIASRQVIRAASITIKHAHREEYDEARQQLVEAASLTKHMQDAVKDAPELRYGGFVGDAEKEYAEAAITVAGILGEALPEPEELGVGYAPWLNGLAEVIGEFRRHVLDLIRRGKVDEAEVFLGVMDDMYQATMSFDYPNAISLGLRGRTDAARGMIERTRGDLTTARRQAHLEQQMRDLQRALNADQSADSGDPGIDLELDDSDE